jgi:hypothetical protein
MWDVGEFPASCQLMIEERQTLNECGGGGGGLLGGRREELEIDGGLRIPHCLANFCYLLSGLLVSLAERG